VDWVSQLSYGGLDSWRTAIKRFLISLTMCTVLAATVMAQDASSAPASKEDVERLLNIMQSPETMNQMMGAMVQGMHQMAHQEYLKDKDKLPAGFEEQQNKMMDDIFKNMPWDGMIQAMVPSYQKHFTKGDIDSLVTFYSSPTGQKVLREMPAIMSDAMESMMPITQKYRATMKERNDQQTADALKKSEKKAN
jgi:hypothetical protein